MGIMQGKTILVTGVLTDHSIAFSVAKIISTGQGGFTVTRNEKIYRKLLAMRTQGVGDIVNAEWSMPGFNFRFTDILASIGIVQLSQLKTRIEKVKNIYQIYSQGIESLPFIKLIPVNLDTEEVPVYIEVLCKYRSRFIDFLESRSIQCRPFYPNLNHPRCFLTNLFLKHGFCFRWCPNS